MQRLHIFLSVHNDSTFQAGVETSISAAIAIALPLAVVAPAAETSLRLTFGQRGLRNHARLSARTPA